MCDDRAATDVRGILVDDNDRSCRGALPHCLPRVIGEYFARYSGNLESKIELPRFGPTGSTDSAERQRDSCLTYAAFGRWVKSERLPDRQRDGSVPDDANLQSRHPVYCEQTAVTAKRRSMRLE